MSVGLGVSTLLSDMYTVYAFSIVCTPCVSTCVDGNMYVCSALCYVYIAVI